MKNQLNKKLKRIFRPRYEIDAIYDTKKQTGFMILTQISQM